MACEVIPDGFREADGFAWRQDGKVDGPIAYGDHERFLTRVLLDHLPGGGVFVDVGAHIGRYSLRMSVPARMVYAIEPHPGNRARLNEHLHVNEVNNVVVIPFAADSAWRAGSLSDNGASSSFTYMPDDLTRIPVATAPLDEVIHAASLIKIDVEGHEAKVLQGATRVITRCQPAIVVEIHPWIEPKLTAAVLDKLNYSHVNVGQSDEQEYWLCLPN